MWQRLRQRLESIDGYADVRFAVLVGLVLRVLPFFIWGWGGCTRDECSYRRLGEELASGQPFRIVDDAWLWAPGYPFLLAGFELVFGDMYALKAVQGVLGAVAVWFVYRITARVSTRRAARVAAWVFAIHPTLVFFSGRIWSEALYSFLLLGAVLSALWAREGTWRRALLPGALVGCCVLFRGVATYMAPIFALALVWPSDSEALFAGLRARWKHSLGLVLAGMLVVAPWSIHATQTYGGFIVSDATFGRMMWLGNNDFEPVTFDQGNGLLGDRAMKAHTRKGRSGHCKKLPTVKAIDQCQVSEGIDHIKANPRQFVRRVPLRLAQLVNPNTFLTRHMRRDGWKMLWPFQDLLAVVVVGFSFLVLLGGTVGAWARARGPYGIIAVGIVLYHVAAIAMLAGLSRYRVPLEPLWIIFLGMVLAEPKAILGDLREAPLRAAGVGVTLPLLFGLMLWFLPAGFPWLW